MEGKEKVMRKRMYVWGKSWGQREEWRAGERERHTGFPLLICSSREEDPGAGNRLDECVIPVENSGCHRQHSSLIRESGRQPHYSACLITAYVNVHQTYSIHTHTHSRCSPPVILKLFWPTHKVMEKKGKTVKVKKKLKGCVRVCVCVRAPCLWLSSSVNRAAAVSMLACYYLI